MWIKRVEIAGWRSFSHDAPVELDDCRAVNLLIGPNNVGKSNVQRFFLQLAHGLNPANTQMNAFSMDVPLGLQLSLRESDIHWSSSGQNQSIRATIDYCNHSRLAPPVLSSLTLDECFALEVNGSERDGRKWGTAIPLYIRARTPLYGRLREGGPYELVNESGEDLDSDSIKKNLQPMRQFLSEMYTSALIDSVRIVEAQRNRELATPVNSSRVKLSPGNISAELHRLKNDRDRGAEWARVQAALQEWLGRVLGYSQVDLDFQTPQNEELVTTLRRGPLKRGNAHPASPLQDLGTGVAEYLTLLAFLSLRTTEEPLAVFIDEIEAHLHPSATRELVRIIRREFPQVQLFLATHSTDLLDQVEDDWRIFRFSMPDTHTVVTPISPKTSEAIDTIWDLGYRPAQLFMANCIIFVEGPSDVVYLNSLLEHLAPHLVEGRDYSFLFYGGANIAHVAYETDSEQLISLLRCANNPIVVCDKDCQDGEPLKAAVARIDSEAKRLTRSVFVTPGYEIESIMTPAALSSVAKEVIDRMNTKNRGTVDPQKLDMTLSLRAALAGAIQPVDPDTSAAAIAERLAGDRKVDIARAFAHFARSNGAASFSSAGLDWGRMIGAAIARASEA